MKKILMLLMLIAPVFSAVEAQHGNSNSLLWRIESKDGGAPSYLFGTIHIPQRKFVVYTDSVYAAIQSTKKFYNEIDILGESIFEDDDAIEFLISRAKYIDSLSKTGAWKSLIARINRKYNTQIEDNNLESFVQFGQKYMNEFTESEEGMVIPDRMLAEFAKKVGKQTGGLELTVSQLKMFFDIIDARLKDTTLDMSDEATVAKNLKKYYASEQLDSIANVIESINANYRILVFDNRNRTMADSIIRQIARETSFFAIGAGHLPGKEGVISILRRKGYNLTPVHSENRISLLLVNEMLEASGEGKQVLQEGVKEFDILEPPPPPMMNIDVVEPQKPTPKKKKKD